MTVRPPILVEQGADPDLLERARANVLRLELQDAATGGPLVITAAVLTLYNAQGTTVVDNATATVSTTEAGVVTYILSAGDLPSTLALGEGWRAVWLITTANGAELVTIPMALCKYVPRPSITTDTLFTLHADLRDAVPVNQAAVGWTPQIRLAWREIQQMLYDQGRRPWLVVTGGSLSRAHTARVLAMIYRDLQTQTQGDAARRAKLATDYTKEFSDVWALLRFDYDRDGDGISDGQIGARSALAIGCGPRSGRHY